MTQDVRGMKRIYAEFNLDDAEQRAAYHFAKSVRFKELVMKAIQEERRKRSRGHATISLSSRDGM